MQSKVRVRKSFRLLILLLYLCVFISVTIEVGMKSYQWIYEHVVDRVGLTKLESRFDLVRTEQEIAGLSDNFLLSNLSRRVFRAGIRHSVVDAKWPEFEKAFFGFDPHKVALMSDELLENLMQNDKIIRQKNANR